MKTWRKECGNGRSRTHAALGSMRVYEGWREGKKLGGFFMVCISAETWGKARNES